MNLLARPAQHLTKGATTAGDEVHTHISQYTVDPNTGQFVRLSQNPEKIDRLDFSLDCAAAARGVSHFFKAQHLSSVWTFADDYPPSEHNGNRG